MSAVQGLYQMVIVLVQRMAAVQEKALIQYMH
jgi:hypothetical protein